MNPVRSGRRAAHRSGRRSGPSRTTRASAAMASGRPPRRSWSWRWSCVSVMTPRAAANRRYRPQRSNLAERLDRAFPIARRMASHRDWRCAEGHRYVSGTSKCCSPVHRGGSGVHSSRPMRSGHYPAPDRGRARTAALAAPVELRRSNAMKESSRAGRVDAFNAEFSWGEG